MGKEVEPMDSPGAAELAPIFLIIGIPATGKSSTSRALALRLPKALHIPVDDLRMMVVSGLVLPAAEWTDALVEQVSLARKLAARMALAYREAGFAAVIDDFLDANTLHDYHELLEQPGVRRVVLLPTQDEAHRRNHVRSGGGPGAAYIDDGIRFFYDTARELATRLSEEGWLVIDNTALTVEETVDAILQRSAAPGADFR